MSNSSGRSVVASGGASCPSNVTMSPYSVGGIIDGVTIWQVKGGEGIRLPAESAAELIFMSIERVPSPSPHSSTTPLNRPYPYIAGLVGRLRVMSMPPNERNIRSNAPMRHLKSIAAIAKGIGRYHHPMYRNKTMPAA